VHINLPQDVKYIIDTLEKNSFEAYAVGGCVRDAVLGKTPKDWDICTQALPEQSAKCFDDKPIFETGLKHGTISLLLSGEIYEITTFRVDGVYKDNRRPESVKFVSELHNDLARRDFTINAMAYHPDKGIIDPFGGIDDIKHRLIRCVGDANMRFDEDALRIMRALRFSSELDFSIDFQTANAIFDKKHLLNNIAAERIRAELDRLLIGDNALNVLTEYSRIIVTVIAEISDMIGFEQNTPYHNLDVWNHTIKSVVNAPADVILRLTMLLHDVGKPHCYTFEDGKGHFYGHQEVGAQMARKILRRLKYDNNTVYAVTALITHHDAYIPLRTKAIRRWLNRIGEERLRQLLLVKKADAMAQAAEFLKPRLDELDAVAEVIDEIIRQGQCFSLKNLAVDGRDLIAAGITEGTEIGRLLNILLDMVINDEIENDHSALMEKIRKIQDLQ